MPVHVSGSHGSGHVCAIVGTYAPGAGPHANAVDHVGLMVDEVCIDMGQGHAVQVYEMTLVGQKTNPLKIDLMGVFDGLLPVQLRKMEQWALEVTRSEHRIEYYVLPASEVEVSDIPGQSPRYVKFTCAGLVERCYRDAAGFRLLVDESLLPEITLKELQSVYVAFARRLARNGANYGLIDGGPWRILMPAYLFHAIRHFDDKGPNAGPYQPARGDWQFPRATTGA